MRVVSRSRVVRHDLGRGGRLRAGGGDGERVRGVLGRVVGLGGGAAAALAGAGRRAARRAARHARAATRARAAAAAHAQQGNYHAIIPYHPKDEAALL